MTDQNEGNQMNDDDEQFASPIDELRGHLFDTIRALKNKSMPVDTARTIVQVATVLVDSAKVEVEMVKATKGKYVQGFVPYKGRTPLPQPDTPAAPVLPSVAPTPAPQAAARASTVAFPPGYFKGSDASE
jgi:hypothetical protein